MKELFALLRRFVPPYKKYVALNIICNILSALLTLVSFAIIIPILEMLFKVNEEVYDYMQLGGGHSLKDVLINNFYYYTQEAIVQWGAPATLAALAALLVVHTGMTVSYTHLTLPTKRT